MIWTHALIVAAIVVLPAIVEIFGTQWLGRLKKYALALAVLLLLALDWAALHDIVKGLETDTRLEYAIVAASLCVFVFLAIRGYTRLQRQLAEKFSTSP